VVAGRQARRIVSQRLAGGFERKVDLACRRPTRHHTLEMPAFNEFGQPIGSPLPGWTPPSTPSRTPMAGQYCRLEPAHERFVAELYAAAALDRDGRTWTYLPYGPPASEDEYREWVSATCLGDDPLFFVIVDLALGRAVGQASYLNIKPSQGSIEVGHIYFSPLASRTRVATEAMYLMMRRAFEAGYRRYEWKCDALNAPSRAAAERLGFTYEGLFRQATVVKGRNRETAWYAAIDSEWPMLAAAFERWLAPENFDASGQQRRALKSFR
jgi:RimJ/RimL family protein N-acetyltransferase